VIETDQPKPGFVFSAENEINAKNVSLISARNRNENETATSSSAENENKNETIIQDADEM